MFHWVEMRTFCHATEDEDKVVAALRTVLPNAEVRSDVLEGHFGNLLVALIARTEKASDIEAIWRRIVDALGKDETLRDLESRIDSDGVYHLRLDKQRAYRGGIERATSDDVISIRAKVASFPRKREVAAGVVRAFVEAL